MFSQQQKIRYVAVDNEAEETVDFEPMKRKICTPACLWTSMFTSALIACYYVPSIGLTFYQKWLYKSFQFPLLTVLVHMSVKFLLAFIIRIILIKNQSKPRMSLIWKDYLTTVAPTGVFGGIDIGLSNWGLELTAMSMYTMTKSTTIIFILLFSIIFNLEKKSWSLSAIVSLIAIGLVLFTYKSTQFNLLGIILLLLASLASGIRWTCVQLLLQKSKKGMKNPIDMIYYMQPCMIISLLPLAIWIEGKDLLNLYQHRSKDPSIFLFTAGKVLLGAFIAFFMEFSEVTLVKYTSSLTLSIAGFMKEVFILVVSIEVNGDVMSVINIVGLFIFLCGIASHVIHKIKTTSTPRKPRPIYEEDWHESGEHLIDKTSSCDAISDSDGEKSDTQVLFNILNQHER